MTSYAENVIHRALVEGSQNGSVKDRAVTIASMYAVGVMTVTLKESKHFTFEDGSVLIVHHSGELRAQ